jgi:branched-chain amino acid transport system substrate-binding protein
MLGLTACGASLGGNNGGGGGEQKLTIGYVTPQTGALAAFGEADKFVVDQMNGYFNDHPIQAGGKSYTVDIVVKDTSPIPVGPAK